MFNIVKHHKYSCTTRIITKPISIGVPTHIYIGLSFGFLGIPLKFHKFWLCADDINHGVGGMNHRYAMDKVVIPLIWLVQKRTSFSHNEVKALEGTCFVFNKQQPILPLSLLVGKNFFPINWLIDVMSWPKTWNGKMFDAHSHLSYQNYITIGGRLVDFLWPPSNHHWRCLLHVMDEFTRFYVSKLQIKCNI